MTTVDDLWFLSDEATQRAERTYHDLQERYEGAREFRATKHVSRRRFRTVATRIGENGAPYGAHTLTYRPDGRLLLVRHAGVDLWVLPGGETDGDEGFRDAAERELHEEAGVEADFDGLALLGRVTFESDTYSTWGVLPIFAAEAVTEGLTIDDPDGEIVDADWFETLPEDTRDRAQLRRWRDRRFGGDRSTP